MANINDEARIPVYINDQQAISALKNLQTEAEKWKKKMYEAMAGGDLKGMKNAERELKNVNREMTALRKESFDVNKVLSNLSTASTKDLRQSLRQINKEMQDLNRGTKEYDAMADKKARVNAELKKINGTLTTQTGSWKKLIGVARMFAPALGITAIIYGLKRLFSASDVTFTEFEQRVDNLSALTGLTGEKLKWLEDQAKETSVSTVDGNVRITQSAKDIVDAYTKVGSKRPELLKVKEDLADVTRESIILSEAAKTDLDPAVDALTMTLNQFNLKAEESRKVINILAAGSKIGAGNIPYLTQAMEKSGTTANLMKVPMEQWAGAVEALAPYYAKAEEAGTSFDRFMLKLQEKQIGYTNGVFDMNNALDQLRHMYANGTTATDIFGVRQAKVGALLVQEQGKFNEYTKAVTGSNIAMEQAAKNTDNETAKRKQARNEMELSALALGQRLSPAMTSVYKLAGKITNGLAKMITPSRIKEIEEEGRQVNLMAMELSNSNTPLDRRRELLETLREINPDIVKGLDAENLNYKTLNENVSAYNDNLANRILFENLSDDEKKYAVKVAKYKQQVGDFQIEINKIISETNSDIALSAATSQEKLAQTIEYLKKKTKSESKVITGYGMADYRSEESKSLTALTVLTDQLSNANKKLANSQQNAEDFKGRIDQMRVILGLQKEIDTGGGSSGGTGNPAKGDRKTVDNIVYEWTGTEWKVVQDLTTEKDVKAAYDREKAMIERRHLEGKTSDDQYNTELLQAELTFLNNKLKLYKAGSQEYLDTVNKALEKRVEVEKTINDSILKAEKELADAKIGSLQEGITKEIAVENQRWTDEKTALQKRLVDKKTLSDQEIALNDTINALIEQKEAGHQKRMNDLKAGLNIEGLQADVAQATPVDPNFATLDQQQKFYDARMALVQAEYEREKQLAGNNRLAQVNAEKNYNSQVLQLQNEQIDAAFKTKEQKISAAQSYVSALAGVFSEESAMGKALFIFNQGLAIADVWINIAKANAKAIAASPLTFGLPWTAINTGMGVAQTAIITAQTVGKFLGKKEGGYTDPYPTDNQVVDYVHSNEFVANAQAVRNPSVKRILDIIDIAQKNGSIANLNLASALASTGRRSGGYGTGSGYKSTTVNNTRETIIQRDPEMVAVIQELRDEIKKGIRGKWYYRDLEEYQDKVNDARDNATL